MTKKRYAVVRGRRATDDLLSAEVSSPSGQAIFDCPDCATVIRILVAGDIVCQQCGSAFVAQSIPGAAYRDKYLLRRKPAE